VRFNSRFVDEFSAVVADVDKEKLEAEVVDDEVVVADEEGTADRSDEEEEMLLVCGVNVEMVSASAKSVAYARWVCEW
jgi:hypothetical protein